MSQFPRVPMSQVWGPSGPPTYANAMAALDPPSAYGMPQPSGGRGGQQMSADEQNPWYREPVLEPRIFFPNDPTVARQVRYRAVTISNQTANTEVSQFVNFDIPSVVYAFSGSARKTDESALPVGLSPRDMFLVRFQHSSANDRLTPVAMIGSCVVGTAESPMLVGAAGYVFNRGGTLEIAITPLVASLRVDICVWVVEIRSQTNYVAPG
jgi:hypothetical protein